MKPFDPALLPHLRPARTALAGVLAGGLLGGLLTVAQAFAMGYSVVRLVDEPAGDAWHTPALWLVVIVAARALASYVSDVCSATAAGQVAVALRRRLLESATGLDALSLGRRQSGELTVLATRGIAATEPYLTRYLPTLVLAVVLPPATIVAMWSLDWLSALIVVLTVPLVPMFAILIGLVTRDRADAQWRQLSALSGHFLDVVRGLPTLVAFRRARSQSERIRSITDRYRVATVETLKVAFLSSAVLELIATISVALVAVAVGLRLAFDGIEFETAMVVLLLAPEAYWPLRRVGAEFHSAAEGTAAFARVSELLDTSAGATPAPTAQPHHAPSSPDGAPVPLRLRSLGFTYPDREQPALHDVDATIPARGLTAITGPSGCGKSTLLALLLGELEPQTGEIRLGNSPRPRPEEWRASVASSSQRPWLTSASIADNLRIGRTDAHDEDLWDALRRVDLDGVVSSLPAGLATVLGEDGAGLSAGQRARLAMARVVVARRPWVLLDEPTAHLDAETERVLLDTLTWLAEHSAVVVVAHRDAVTSAADHVVALPAPDAVASPADAEVVAQAKPRLADTTSPDDRPMRWGRRTGLFLGTGSVAFGVALTATASWLITRASAHPPVLYLMVAIVGVRLFGLGRPVLRWAERVVSHDAALRLLAQRRAQVYDDLVPLVPGALGRHRGEVLTSVVDDVDSLVDAELRVRQPWWTAVAVGVGAVLFAWWQAPSSLLPMLGVVAVGLAAFPLARWAARGAEDSLVTQRAELSRLVTETLDSARHLVLWDAVESSLARVDAAGTRLARAASRTAAATATARTLPVLAGGLGLVAVSAATGPHHPAGSAMLALVVMLPIALTDAFTPLGDAGALSVRTAAARGRLDSLTSQPPRVQDPASPRACPAGVLSPRLRELAAGWGEAPAFTGVDLDLHPGEQVGVVGPSGCGKSTLAATLMRFLDPYAGRVELVGHVSGSEADAADLRELALDDVRRAVGLVDDDPHVFASTVAENVRLARPDADDDEVLTALRGAHLGSWLGSLPAGMHTFVGEGHASVSGGERARLAIARALLADAPVLVLDEPTAHLDSATARQVAVEVLDGARAAGGSVVWITHGTVGLDEMDRVLRLDAAGGGVSPAERQESPAGA
ncbi:MAG: thiol reductant ABC exporter subunit CydD [Nocardioides sp.]|nr:thiol reductant ABC exporter subunit CydD [Nocardioides sp.]